MNIVFQRIVEKAREELEQGVKDGGEIRGWDADAIEGEGNIWIETKQSDDSVIISIRDDGKGIPEKNKTKIFDPFFTTKPVGSGTGLGLSITHTIIDQHNGSITVESEEEKGTTFTVILPIEKNS